MDLGYKNKAIIFFGRMAICAVCALFLWSADAFAQARGSDQAYLKAGIKSLGAGKAQAAVDQLSKAISSGKLPDKDAAVALLKRGEAYRLSQQHGLAIADFTSALFMKALGPKDQEKAYLERARAYSSLGMTSQTAEDIKSASRVSGKSISSEAVAAKPQVPAAAPKPQAPIAAPASPQPAVQAAKPAAVPAAPPVVASPPPVPAVAPAPPAQPAPSSSFDPVKSVSNFFDNLIPGSSSSPKPAPVQTPPAAPAPQVAVAQAEQGKRPVWMADPSVTTPQPVPEVAVMPDGGNNVSSWGGSTQVAVAKPKRPTQAVTRKVAAKAPTRKPVGSSEIVGSIVTPKKKLPPKKVAAIAPKPAPVASSAYMLQLAKASSQGEAGQVWNSLAAAHPHLLSGLTPVIRASSRGGYFVGLGPFNKKSSTQKICNSFKTQGLSCAVVSQ